MHERSGMAPEEFFAERTLQESGVQLPAIEWVSLTGMLASLAMRAVNDAARPREGGLPLDPELLSSMAVHCRRSLGWERAECLAFLDRAICNVHGSSV